MRFRWKLDVPWGRYDPQIAISILDSIPDIVVPMMERVGAHVTHQPWLSFLSGPLSGTPYKIYAVQTGAQDLTS